MKTLLSKTQTGGEVDDRFVDRFGREQRITCVIDPAAPAYCWAFVSTTPPVAMSVPFEPITGLPVEDVQTAIATTFALANDHAGTDDLAGILNA